MATLAYDGCRVLDLCTGSGCIGLAVAKHVTSARVVLADLSEDALHVARANARRNGLTSRVMCLQADAMQAPPSMLGLFDVIVCNPPLYTFRGDPGLDHSVRDFEPIMALDGGRTGWTSTAASPPSGRMPQPPGGTMIFEVGYDQADAVEQMMALAVTTTSTPNWTPSRSGVPLRDGLIKSPFNGTAFLLV